MPDRKPCPFCGCTDPPEVFINWAFVFGSVDPNDTAAALCPRCDASGPSVKRGGYTKKIAGGVFTRAALEAWDGRHA
jgi:hypothetical protein